MTASIGSAVCLQLPAMNVGLVLGQPKPAMIRVNVLMTAWAENAAYHLPSAWTAVRVQMLQVFAFPMVCVSMRVRIFNVVLRPLKDTIVEHVKRAKRAEQAYVLNQWYSSTLTPPLPIPMG